MRDLIDRILGHYRIVEKIGEGGMGEVYRAHDERLDRDVAIKVLPALVAKDPERVARFEREARAVARLDHPNILAIHDFGTEEDVTYSVTELLAGETLRERLGRGALGWRKAAEIGVSIADGLAAAHGAGIIHRDLKPDNVFITSDGRVKTLDFGLARDVATVTPDESHSPTVTRYTDPGTVMGTAGYMSPEQVRGEPADQRSDIFALGSVFYEMATGRRAFARDTAAETMAAILNEQPPDVEGSGARLPPEMVGIIGRCLEKTPQARFQSASDLSYYLRSLASASAESQADQSRKATGWRKLVLGVVAAAVVVAGLVWLNIGGWRSRLPEPDGSASIESLAVLPFVNVGGEQEVEYLSDGIPASIIDRLSKLSALDVVPRSSSFHFRKPGPNVADIGRRLAVSAILAGEVRSQNETLVIRVELVDVSSNRQLWGERFTRKLDDVLEIEVEIATQVTKALRIELGGAGRGLLTRGGTSNPVAHRHFLRGRHFRDEVQTEDGLRRAIESFNEAIEEDPNFALAYCGIADAWLILNDWDCEPQESALVQVRQAVRQALALDENLAEVHLILALVSEFEWDPVTAQREYLRALDLDPQWIGVRGWYAWFLALQGRLDTAITEAQTILDRDQLSMRSLSRIIQFLNAARRHDEALEHVDNALKLYPNEDRFNAFKGRILAAQGKYDEAFAEFEKVGEFQNSWLAFYGWTFGRAGRRDDAFSVLSEMRRRATETSVSPAFIALIHAGLGENDLAFKWLERALEERSTQLSYLKFEPEWDPLRDDARFAEFISRIRYFIEE